MFIQDDKRIFRLIGIVGISVIIGIMMLYGFIVVFISGLKTADQGRERHPWHDGGVAYVGDFLVAYGANCSEDNIGFYVYKFSDSWDGEVLMRDVISGTKLDPDDSLANSEVALLGYGIDGQNPASKSGWMILGGNNFETSEWAIDISNRQNLSDSTITIISSQSDTLVRIDDTSDIPAYGSDADLEAIDFYSGDELKTAKEWREMNRCSLESTEFHSIEDLLSVEGE